jgi:hypothetical protein
MRKSIGVNPGTSSGVCKRPTPVAPSIFQIGGMRLSFVSLSLWAATIAFPSLSLGHDDAQLEIGGGTLNVSFDSKTTPEFRQLALDWITRAANAVTVYYTHFPVRHVDIAIHVRSGRAVGQGRASGEGGPHIEAGLGSSVTARILSEGDDNWLMTHEMVHLALTGVEEEHHWLEEGLATYVEPIARVRAGELKAQDVWRDMMEGMPQGEPVSGDQGLDHTPTWGRTYWGGAMFCLLADVEIRTRTKNKMGLEHALRGIVAAGGTIDTDWGLARVLSTGDQAIGVPVLGPLYDRMKAESTPVDLAALWKRLGVEERDGSVVFHDEAPLADVRRAIMRP